MRKIFTLILLAASITATAQLNTGLIAHWNFNGTANDVSGNGLNGTAANVTYTTGKNNNATGAASFNGTSSVIAVPYNSKMNSAHLSVCAIVKFNDFYKGACQHSMVLQRGNHFAPGSYSLSIFDNAYDGGNCSIYDSTKMTFHQKIANVESGVPLDSFKHTPTVNKNQWYCVVATFDGSRVKVYVDGVECISYSSNEAFGTSSEGLAIGANTFTQPSTYPYWLNGAIDDMRLYNRVLTPSEIDSFCSFSDNPSDTVTTSVHDLVLNNLALYPNPNTGSFNITASHINAGEVQLTVYNPTGQQLVNRKVLVTSGKMNEHINLQNCANGIYLLRISANGKERNIRFVVNQ